MGEIPGYSPYVQFFLAQRAPKYCVALEGLEAMLKPDQDYMLESLELGHFRLVLAPDAPSTQ